MAFKSSYARWYDLFYLHKDYESECDYIERIWRNFKVKPKHVLDLTCGTGGHLLPLARRGYEMTGIDFSAAMLGRAKVKASKMKLGVELRQADMRKFRLGRRFDSCISMFDSIDYLSSDKQLEETFTNVSSHLTSGGLFIFQFWNGLAVLADPPRPKLNRTTSGSVTALRMAQPELVESKQLCRITYEVVIFEGKRIIDGFTEVHNNRFLFPDEVSYVLSKSGFTAECYFPFMKLDPWIGAEDWSVVCVARRGDSR